MNKINYPLFSYALSRKGYVICFFFIIFALIWIALSVRGNEATNRFYDVIRTTGQREEVVIVGIDDKSLEAFGAWPWDRTVFGDLNRVLSEAKVNLIAYDILFLEPRAGDENFKKELLRTERPVIFASKRDDNQYLSSYLASGTPAVSNALANVEPDVDGKVRKYPSAFTLEGTCVESLGQKAFEIYTHEEAARCGTSPLYFFRYPETIKTYSLVDIVRGDVPKEALENKVIFIGSVTLDLEDHFVGIHGNKVPGVYVHASVFTSLLNRIADKPLSGPWSAFLLVFMAMVSAYFLMRSKTVYVQIASVVALMSFALLISMAAYTWGLILPLPWLLTDVLISTGYVALVRFVTERKQNEQVQSLFSKYVHKDVLANLMTAGTEIKLGGERKTLSVLFSDLRGFTSFSESLSPEELTSLLNGYLGAMTPHILEEKGTIDKFIGDAIMAFWNAPLPVENHALHAVRSALRMHTALKNFNEEHGTELAMGIGIHTGPAVVGNVGGQDRVNYTALGDTVNLASRIEGLTKKYGVGTIVTNSVRDAVSDDLFSFRCLDVITVLGKNTPTALYEVRYASDVFDGLVSEYEKAFKYYYEKQWNKAEVIFKKLAKKGDIPSERILSRIPELRKKADWDGIWRFDEK